MLNQAAVGLLLSAGLNTAAIQASSAFVQKYGIDSRLIQICAIISALAISTLALPWILSVASLQGLALLSFETAIESTLLHLAFKTAAYGAFRTGLYLKDSFAVTLPTSLENVQNMSSTELQRVRDHLVDFPSKEKYIPLPVHQELRAKLKEALLESPPLTHFSELGENWSDHDLRNLHEQDLKRLPLPKRKQLNELFLARDFPPQERPYELGELPQFEPQAVLKLTTSSKVSWTHLILRLNKKIEIPNGLPKLFYKYELPPVRDEWIPLSPPSSEKAVAALKDYEISWHQNFYAKNTQEWEALSPEMQTALKAHFKTPSLFSSTQTTPLKGRASKTFPWSHIGTAVALGALGLTAYYILSQGSTTTSIPMGSLLDKSHIPTDSSLLRKPIETILKPSTALFAVGPLVDHTTSLFNLSDIQIINKFFQYSAPIAHPIIKNTSTPELCPNLSFLDKIQYLATKTLPPSNFQTVKPLPPITSSPYITWSAVAIAALAISSAAYAFHYNQRNKAGLNFDLPESMAPLPGSIIPLSSKVQVKFGNSQYEIDCQHSEIGTYLPFYLEHLRKEVTNDPSIDKIALYVMNREYTISRDQFLDRLECLLKERAAEKREMKAIEKDPLRALTKEKFMKYCKDFNVGYHHQTAWDDAKEGLRFYQKILVGKTIEPSKDNLRKICWGMMAHAIEDGEGFENGTFTVADPGYRLFKLFTSCSESYGRASSHFNKRAIPTSEGDWMGYSHFGVDIENLPPNMQTVLMGMIEMKDDKEITYIKLEDWGADMYIKSFEKFKHFFFHSFGFLTSQYKRFMETNQVSGDRKEHMKPKHKKIVLDFVARFGRLIPDEVEPDLNEWGYIEAVPYLVKLLEHPELEEKDALEIDAFVTKLHDKYGEKLYTQKGGEIQIDEEVEKYDPESLIRSILLTPETIKFADESSSKE